MDSTHAYVPDFSSTLLGRRAHRPLELLHAAHALAMQPPASDLADPEQEAWIARRAFAAGIEPTSVRHVALDADAPQAAAGWPAPTLRGAET